MKLGRWAVIDIETTGLDPAHDAVIDVGFLQFEEVKLVKSYRSLVRLPSDANDLSHFIQNLTGITPKMLIDAPSWEEVEKDIQSLDGHSLLAHNAGFEQSFLGKSFESLPQGVHFEDDLLFLPLLFPRSPSFGLEHFIQFFKIHTKEAHRGLEDATDLLKVLIASVKWARQDRAMVDFLQEQFKKYYLEDYWYYRFFTLPDVELDEIARQLDFHWKKSLPSLSNQKQKTKQGPRKGFPLDFSGKNIQKILQDTETIQKKIPSYRYRKTQETMALKVGQSLKNEVHALIQAPTGTGKTLGHLLPAVLFSLDAKEQVLVTTGTKALQNQAMTKDIPQLRKILGLSGDNLKIVQMVGSSNHLCELLFRQKLEGISPLSSSREEKIILIFFEMLFFHNAQAEIRDVLLRDDLPWILKRKLKGFMHKERQIAVDFRSCTGSRCPFKHDCSYLRCLTEAKNAHVIVGNHALMFTWPGSLKRPEYIIVDEAHKIEEGATKSYCMEVNQAMLETLLEDLNRGHGIGYLYYLLAQTEKDAGESTPIIKGIKKEVDSLKEILTKGLEDLSGLMEQLFEKNARYTRIYWNEISMVSPQESEISKAVFQHLEMISHAIAGLIELLVPYREKGAFSAIDQDNQVMKLTAFETFMGLLDDMKKVFSAAFHGLDNFLCTLKFHKEHGYALVCSPIDIGRILHDKLLKETRSTVFTSATLASASGNFGEKGIEWSTGFLYLSPKRRFKNGLFLPSIYDYKNNTKVFLCQDTPSIYDKNFVKTALRPVVELIRKIKGRSLLLFSARSRFEEACEILLTELKGEIPVFIQGMGNSVLENFKRTEGSILVGMESFGEGVDIPGSSLQFLFIDKIPDLRMDRIIQDRRVFYQENIGNEFIDYYLAHRTRSLQQKLGRLLRTENDIGGAVIVDSRTKKWAVRTMQQVKELMMPYKIEKANLTDACNGIYDFIKGGFSSM